MTGQAEAILRTVERIYDSAFEPDAWTQCLDAVRDLMGAEHAIFHRTVQGAVVTSVSCQRLTGVMEQVSHRISDPFFIDHIDRLPVGPAVAQTSYISMEAFARTDYYNTVVRPIGGGQAAVALPWRNGSDVASIIVCRPLAADRFTRDNLRVLDLLTPHLATAGRLARRLAMEQAVVDAMGIGVVLVDRAAAPIHMNPQAEAFIAAADGLSVSSRRLVAGTAAETRMLHEAVAATAMTRSGIAAADSTIRWVANRRIQVPIRRRVPKCPLVLTIIPANALEQKLGLDRPAEAAILISDPSITHSGGMEQLISLHGLTRREAELVSLIVDGVRLAEAAEILDITVGTARQYLKSVFSKTGAESQADLVRLVLRGY
ncbi:helix-turn-helix transcriptional regulator [Inquilinus sp. CA228]|uniref:helix-turn-helix transcriptional regulator n=1 Tax=Inquilinus sp. CA228 TaxID=3455609 RepID=UPI003F8D5303